MPDLFGDADTFDLYFQNTTGDVNKTDNMIQALHKILKPFLLRRIKSDVEKSLLPKIESYIMVGMSNMQRKWYRNILLQN